MPYKKHTSQNTARLCGLSSMPTCWGADKDQRETVGNSTVSEKGSPTFSPSFVGNWEGYSHLTLASLHVNSPGFNRKYLWRALQNHTAGSANSTALI